MKKSFFLLVVSWVLISFFTLEVVRAQSIEKNVADSITKSASFPGGISALFEFLADSVKYPKSALAHSIKQKVGIQITVDQEGDISQVSTPPGLRKDFEIEARRIVSKMPKWLPALKDGLPIASTVFFTIMFTPPK